MPSLGFMFDGKPLLDISSVYSVAGRKNSYGLLNVIGRGSYGVVYRATNHTTGETVALKHEVCGLSRSTLREIKILMSLPRHSSIVEYKEVVNGGGGTVYVVMEYLPSDLHRYIHKNWRGITMAEFKAVMERILEGVKFLHQNGVMHRDLKPANILIDRGKEKVRICDFGLSRLFVPGASGQGMTSGVGTRWYKAPELLQGESTYSSAIDMWSVGCIMGEMVLKKPLFQGKSSSDQLRLVHQGLPGNDVDRLMCYLGASGFDLVHRLLAYDPDLRITAEDALDHAWFNEYYESYSHYIQLSNQQG